MASKPAVHSIGQSCPLRSPLCVHETPIVPRFFALYRETEFFRGAFRGSPSFLVILLFAALSFLPLSFVIPACSARPLPPRRYLPTSLSSVSLTPHFLRRILNSIGELTCFASVRANWLRVPLWSAEDPLNLLQVMLAKGVYISSFPGSPGQPINRIRIIL